MPRKSRLLCLALYIAIGIDPTGKKGDQNCKTPVAHSIPTTTHSTMSKTLQAIKAVASCFRLIRNVGVLVIRYETSCLKSCCETFCPKFGCESTCLMADG